MRTPNFRPRVETFSPTNGTFERAEAVIYLGERKIGKGQGANRRPVSGIVNVALALYGLFTL